MRPLLYSLVFSFLIFDISQAKVVKAADVPGLSKLLEQGVREFHVCGDSNIQPTKKSLNKNFMVGSEGVGFLYSNLISYQDYRNLLTEKNLEEAKSEIAKRFSNTHLWKCSAAKGCEDLGAPQKVQTSFTSTIKDCVEGAKTTLGVDCSGQDSLERRRVCCGEKFPGPHVFWGSEGQYKLMYSPDPSVRMVVPGEKKHRYCNVQELVHLQ